MGSRNLNIIQSNNPVAKHAMYMRGFFFRLYDNAAPSILPEAKADAKVQFMNIECCSVCSNFRFIKISILLRNTIRIYRLKRIGKPLNLFALYKHFKASND
jgi:hypothetical protein